MPALEREIVARVALPCALQRLLAQQQQCLVQREQAVDRRGVVIRARGAAPVVQDEPQVHEPAMDLLFAVLHVIDHALRVETRERPGVHERHFWLAE